MKKGISLLLVLLITSTMAVGCGQNTKSDETSKEIAMNETVENITGNEAQDNDKTKDATTNSGNTELFGVPQETDDYDITDLSDPESEYILENRACKVVGMEGYIIVSQQDEQGRNVAGSSFFIWARYGKAIVIKGIDCIGEDYHITLEEVEKGTPQSHEMLNIVARKPFKKQFIKYTDGTYSRNLDILDLEVGLEKVKGEFQKVDFVNNTIDIISPGVSGVRTYTMVDVAPESLEGLQKGDEIEYMCGSYHNDTVYGVKKVENQ